jgi:hypothetical protein
MPDGMRLRLVYQKLLLLETKLVQILSDKYISISHRRQLFASINGIDKMPSVDASVICFILQPKSVPKWGDEQEGIER